MNLYTYICTFFILLIPTVLCSRFCQWSHKTAETVSLCPQNKSAMEERAKIKNCTVIAKIQRCTDPEKFKYHCVMNELETTFVELCAPQYIIHGYCTEYNSLGAAIQEHFSLKCSDVKPSCNKTYLSTDAYLNKGCSKMVRKDIQLSSTDLLMDPVIQTTTVNHLLNNKSKNTTLLIIITVIAIAAFAVLTLSVCLIVKRWRVGSDKLVKKKANAAEMQFIRMTKEKTTDNTNIEIKNMI